MIHWARFCQHANDQNEKEEKVYEANIVLFNDAYSEEDNGALLGEMIGSMVLDSGCSRSVCGEAWYDCFIDALPESTRQNFKKKVIAPFVSATPVI